jgi:hypothetical protein
MLATITMLSLTVFAPLYACSLAIPPIVKFNPNEYVFTGRVVGIVGPSQSKRFSREGWGLQIELNDVVYLPRTPKRYFEVYPFDLWADCSLAGTAKEELVKYYPIGSSVKVIARKAKLLSTPLAEGDLRLEISPYSWSEISRNYLDDGTEISDARSVFDYHAYKMITPADYVSDFMPFLDAKVALPAFELRKDLLRLETNKLRSDRITILERLMYYPIGGPLSYYGVTEHYAGSKMARSLSDRREVWIEELNGKSN